MRCGQVGRFSCRDRSCRADCTGGCPGRVLRPGVVFAGAVSVILEERPRAPAPGQHRFLAACAPLPAWAPRLRCRAQRGNGKARTARATQPPTMSRGAGYHISPPPLCSIRAVFRRSLLSADDGLRCGGWGPVDVDVERVSRICWGSTSRRRQPARRVRLRGVSVAAEAAGQVDVEGVEVEVAHLGEAFGGPRVGQGLGELVAPVLVSRPAGFGVRPGPRPTAPPGTSAGPDVAAERGRRRRGARGSGVAVERR